MGSRFKGQGKEREGGGSGRQQVLIKPLWDGGGKKFQEGGKMPAGPKKKT